MGRHRRSGAAPAAEGNAAGSDRRYRSARRKKGGAPVRTGLLGVSAAVAVGAVAVASGLLPGGDRYTVGSVGSGDRPSESRQAPELTTQGGSSVSPTSPSNASDPSSPSRPSTAAPSGTPAPTPSKTTASPAPKATQPSKPSKTTETPGTPRTQRTPKPAPTTEEPVTRAEVPSQVARDVAAEAEVVRLVNQERAKVGCAPVRSDAKLAALAGSFSADMAKRDFFDHTDPDGATPWERAAKAGVSGLGGENIARGQVDAAAVMSSWMNSDGHRANILNCDYRTTGVGVYFADGGPWWTQDFGF